MSRPPIPPRDLRAIFGQPEPEELESPLVSNRSALALGFLSVALIHALTQAPALSIAVVILALSIVLTAKVLADYAPRILKALKGEGGWL